MGFDMINRQFLPVAIINDDVSHRRLALDVSSFIATVLENPEHICGSNYLILFLFHDRRVD